MTNITLILSCLFQMIINAKCQNSSGSTSFDGVSQDQLPSYFSLDGSNGIIFPLMNRQINQPLDYYFRVWLRLSQDYDRADNNTSEQLLEFHSSLRCLFIYNSSLTCFSTNLALNRTQQMTLNISGLKEDAWVCLTQGGQFLSNLTYLRLDYLDRPFRGVNSTYMYLFSQNATSWNLTLGRNSSAMAKVTSTQRGFIGDVRELYSETSFLNYSQGGLMRNQIFSWDDNQLADYRLQKGNLQSSVIANFTAQVQTSSENGTQGITPSWDYDYIANDMCYAYFNQATVLRSNGSYQGIFNGTIDSRMNTSIAQYQYTSSLWIKTLTGIKANQTFSSNLSFFSLVNSFHLWFTDANNIRLLINATTSSAVRQTGDFFIPYSQWANIQFIIDRSQNNVEMRIYDQNRRLLQINSQSMTLGVQAPTRNFQIFQNFVGYIKSIMVFQSRQVLPLSPSAGIVNDSTLLIYFKFDTDNYQNMQFNALNQNSQNQTGQPIIFQSNPIFETLQWEENLSFTRKNSLGTTTQSGTLFDGISCNDQKLIYSFSSPQNYLSYDLQLTQALTQGSIEFWFSKTALSSSKNSPQYFFGIFSNSNPDQEYFTIKQFAGDSDLRCSPIIGGPQVASLDNLGNLTSQWIHYTCKFSSQFDVTTVYQISGSEDRIITRDEITQMVVPQGSYQAFIANNNKFSATPLLAFMKEIRLWNSYRSNRDILQFRYNSLNKANEGSSLLLYARLASGDPYPLNMIGLQKPTNLIGLPLTIQPDSQTQNCPLNTYLDPLKQLCMQNPYLNQSVLMLPQINMLSSNNYSVSYYLTSLYSDYYQYFLDTRSMSAFFYTWQILTNSSDLKIDSSQIENEKLKLNQSFVNQLQNRSSASLTFYQTAQGQFNSFQQSSSYMLTPQNCTVVVDSLTLNTQVQQYLNFSRGDKDINLTLRTIKYQDCGINRTVTILPNISVSIFPSALQINETVQSYNSSLQNFTIQIPKSQQQKFPYDLDINIILTVGFRVIESYENSTIRNQSWLAFQNLVYTLKFVYPIKPVLKLSQLSNSIILGETIRVFGNESFQTLPNNSSSQQALSYIWTCPQEISSLCASKQGNRYFEINFQDTQDFSLKKDTPYSFMMSVWKSTHEDPYYNQSQNFTLTWTNTLRPDFAIIPFNNSILQAQQDNMLNISLKNYNVEQGLVSFEWSFSPSIDSSLITFSTLKDQVKILKGALQNSKTYTVSVQATLKQFSDANSNQTFTFTLGSGFTQTGVASISPTQITALSSLVSFTVRNYLSNDQPIRYNVYCLNNQTRYNNFKLLLNSQPVSQSVQLQTYIPRCQSILFQLLNQDGQYTQTQIEVTSAITQIEGEALKTLVAQIIQQNTQGTSAVLMRLRTISYNLYLNDESYKNQSVDVKQSIINFLLTYSQGLSNRANDLSDDAELRTQLVFETLMFLTDSNSPANDDLITNSLIIIQNLRQLNVAMNSLISNSDTFSTTFTQALSNLQSYIKQYKGSSSIEVKVQAKSLRRNMSKSRMLPDIFTLQDYQGLQSFIKAIEEQFSFLSSQICASATQGKLQQKQLISSSTISELSIERVPFNQLVQNRTHLTISQDVTLSLPYSIVSSFQAKISSTNSSQRSDLCYSVQFSRYNSLMTFNFTNQTIASKLPMVKFDIKDTMNSQSLLQTYWDQVTVPSINNQRMSNVINITYRFQFNDSSLGFRNNQTVCLAILNNQASYLSLSWSDKVCDTVYSKASNQISCFCKQFGPFYIAIGNDLSRVYVPDEYSLFDKLWSILKEFDSSIIAIIIPLVLMLLILPPILLCLEGKSFNHNESGEFDVTDEIIQKIADMKDVPFEALQYDKARLDTMFNLEHLSFGTRYGIFINQLHTLIGLFTCYDFYLKRLYRCMFLLFQISSIAIIAGLVFGTTYRSDESDNADRDEGLDSTDVSNSIIAGVCLAVLCFPTMNYFLEKFRIKIVYKNQSLDSKLQNQLQKNENNNNNNNRQHSSGKNSARNAKTQDEFDITQEDIDGDSGTRTQHTQNRLKNSSGNKNDRSVYYREDNSMIGLDISRSAKNQSQIKGDPVITNQNNCLKVTMLFLCFIWTVLAMLTVGLESGANPKANSQAIVLSFWIAVLAGLFLYDFILIALITILTPGLVREELDYNGDIGLCSKLFNCLIIPERAKEIERDLILIADIREQMFKGSPRKNFNKQNGPDSKSKQRNQSQEQSPDKKGSKGQTPQLSTAKKGKGVDDINTPVSQGKFKMPNQVGKQNQAKHNQDNYSVGQSPRDYNIPESSPKYKSGADQMRAYQKEESVSQITNPDDYDDRTAERNNDDYDERIRPRESSASENRNEQNQKYSQNQRDNYKQVNNHPNEQRAVDHNSRGGRDENSKYYKQNTDRSREPDYNEDGHSHRRGNQGKQSNRDQDRNQQSRFQNRGNENIQASNRSMNRSRSKRYQEDDED